MFEDDYRENVVDPFFEMEEDRRYEKYLSEREEVMTDLNRGIQKVTLSASDIR